MSDKPVKIKRGSRWLNKYDREVIVERAWPGDVRFWIAPEQLATLPRSVFLKHYKPKSE
jgi:hypothetical protein